MDMRKFVPAVIITFVLCFVLMYVIHQVLLVEDYAALRGMMREVVLMPFILLGEFVFAVGFVYIYSRGVEVKPWFGQAICYAVALWVVASLAASFITYAVYPFEMGLIVKQVVYSLIAYVIMAIPVAYIYRINVVSPKTRQV